MFSMHMITTGLNVPWTNMEWLITMWRMKMLISGHGTRADMGSRLLLVWVKGSISQSFWYVLMCCYLMLKTDSSLHFFFSLRSFSKDLLQGSCNVVCFLLITQPNFSFTVKYEWQNGSWLLIVATSGLYITFDLWCSKSWRWWKST